MRKQQETYAAERMALRKVSDIAFVDLRVKADSNAAGKTLAEMQIFKRVNVVSVERDGTVIIPHGDTRILVGDLFTFLCRPEDIGELKNFFS